MVDKDLLSMQEARSLVRAARGALATFATYPQEKVDLLVHAVAKACECQAESLAKLAVEETGFGKWRDKKEKNLLASRKLWEHIKEMKTIGVIAEDHEKKIIEIATPAGVIAGVIPSTNPTSTVIFKAMSALKAGNGIIFSPHPAAVKCIRRTVEIIQEALVANGAPVELVSTMSIPTLEGSLELMRQVDLILATGGPGMVKAAYSSGTPALGVGAGNVPVFIERSADPRRAVERIMVSKTFDNGTVCASEQAVICERVNEEAVCAALNAYGGYFLTEEQAIKVKAIMERCDGSMNPAIVGRDADYLARLAGISIPEETKVLLYREKGIGAQYPFSKEKLTSLLGFYVVENWQEACEKCHQLLTNGGIGHSLSLHCSDEKVIREFALQKPVSRLLINTPSSQGAVGISTNLAPSLTLGCGTVGGSATSDNVGPLNLFNIRRVATGVEERLSSEQDSCVADVEQTVRMVTELVMKELAQSQV